MKFFISVVIFILTVITISCNDYNLKSVDEKTDIPFKVVNALKDSTLQFNYTKVSTETDMYLLKKNTSTKEVTIEERYKLKDESNIVGIYCILVGLIGGCFVGAIFSRD